MAYAGKIIEIAIDGGITGVDNLSNTQDGQLLEANSVTFDAAHGITRELGTQFYGDSPVACINISGGWYFTGSDGQTAVVLGVFEGAGPGTRLVRDLNGSGSFSTTLATGLSGGPYFVEGGKETAANAKKLFIFMGSSAVQVMAEATDAATSALTTPPADWAGTNQPSFGCIHEGRLWGGGNANDAHRMYYSTTGNHEDFTGAGSGSLAIFPGEGGRLVAAMSFKGLLLCWKTEGIYYIDTTDPTITNWKVRRLTLATGGANNYCAAVTDNDVVFVDPRGNLQVLSATQEFGNMQTNNLGYKDQIPNFLRQHFRTLAVGRVAYHAKRRELHVTVGDSLYARYARMTVDFNHDKPRFRLSFRDAPVAMWQQRDEIAFTEYPADPFGAASIKPVNILNFNSYLRSGRGSPVYESAFQTVPTDLSYADPSLAAKRKNGDFLELIVSTRARVETSSTGAKQTELPLWHCYVDVYWDDVLTETLEFFAEPRGDVLTSDESGTITPAGFTLDTDVLVNADTMSVKHRLTGSGRRISLRFHNNNGNEFFAISKVLLHFRVADEATR